jgi:hypothetical protein
MGYVFDPHVIHDIARGAVGLRHDEMCRHVIDKLAERYPRYVERRISWVYNYTGGATGILNLIHASLSEYVFIYGSPIGTEGFSGRYLVEIYDCVLAGEMWTYRTDSLASKNVYGPGDISVMPRGVVEGWRLTEGAWLLEYARGPIPTMLPLGLIGSVLGTMDAPTVGKTLWLYGRQVTRNLLRGKI